MKFYKDTTNTYYRSRGAAPKGADLEEVEIKLDKDTVLKLLNRKPELPTTVTTACEDGDLCSGSHWNSAGTRTVPCV